MNNKENKSNVAQDETLHKETPPTDFLSKVSEGGTQQEAGVKIRFKFSRREIAVIAVAAVLVLAVLVFFLIFLFGAKQTPRQAVEAYAQQNEGVEVHSIVSQVALDESGSRFGLFFKLNSGMGFTVVENSVTGYEITEPVVLLQNAPVDESERWMVTAINDGKEYIVVGVMLGSEYTGVKVNGQPATVIDNGDTRCWYYLGEGNIAISSDSIKYE